MKTAAHSPRILFVSEAWALAASIGPRVRCLNQLRALQEVGKVEVVTLDQANSGLQVPKGVPITCSLENKDRPNSGPLAKLRFTVDPTTNYPYGCGVDDGDARRFLRKATEFDLIWFFKQRAADSFPDRVWAHSVVDIDDVQSTYERAALDKSQGLRRLNALRGLYSWRRREKLLGKRFTVLTVCSPGDKAYLESIGVRAPIHVVPNGYEKPPVEPVRYPATAPRIGFIGAFDYPPNREGVAWFIASCWPAIKEASPDARLRLIGRDSEKFSELASPDVDRLGAVTDPAEEMSTWSSMIVPIHLGAGTRVKIAHGFSQKCPIVSTSLGAFGYDPVDGREMYLADSPADFSAACLRTISDPEAARQMAERGWQSFLNNWSWDAIRPRIWAAAEECLRANHRE